MRKAALVLLLAVLAVLPAGATTIKRGPGGGGASAFQHATDCALVTNAPTGAFCQDLDSNALYVCEVGPCSSTNAWTAYVSAGGLASTDIDTSSELRTLITDETGSTSATAKIVFNDDPTFTGLVTMAQLFVSAAGARIDLSSAAPVLSIVSTGVNDAADGGIVRLENAATICWEASPAGTDVCIGPDTSEVFQVTGGKIDGGDIANGTVTTTQVGTDLTAGNLAATLTFADGDLLDLSAINESSATEGIKLPQAATCTSATAQGQLCWATTGKHLWVGDGTASPVDIGPSSGTGHVIEDEATPLTQRSNLNFTGAGVSCADSGGKTVCTISGGGGAITNPVDVEGAGTYNDSTCGAGQDGEFWYDDVDFQWKFCQKATGAPAILSLGTDGTYWCLDSDKDGTFCENGEPNLSINAPSGTTGDGTWQGTLEVVGSAVFDSTLQAGATTVSSLTVSPSATPGIDFDDSVDGDLSPESKISADAVAADSGRVQLVVEKSDATYVQGVTVCAEAAAAGAHTYLGPGIDADGTGGTCAVPTGNGFKIDEAGLMTNTSGTAAEAIKLTSAAPQITLGVNTTTLGSIKMFGNTSGSVTLAPTAAAGAAHTVSLPTTTGTLVGTGDTGTVTGTMITATLDLGDATSLQIPNGAGPTVDTTGEIAVDTSATRGQLVFSSNDATTVSALDPKRTENWVIESPVNADHFTSIKLPYPITLLSVDCIVDPADAGDSIDINIQECDSTADNCANNQGAALTCDNDGSTTYTDFSGAAGSQLDATDWLALDIASDPTGTVSTLTVTLRYIVTRE